jgi:hypothetical protein
MLLGIILAQWWHPVASSEALNLLHRAMRAVTYRGIAMAIKMASFAGVFVDCCLYACFSSDCWGNMDQVVTQCRRPVAFEAALDMPHWAMPSVLLRHTLKRPADEVHSFAAIAFFVCCNCSLRPCYGQLK